MNSESQTALDRHLEKHDITDEERQIIDGELTEWVAEFLSDDRNMVGERSNIPENFLDDVMASETVSDLIILITWESQKCIPSKPSPMLIELQEQQKEAVKVEIEKIGAVHIWEQLRYEKRNL